MTLVLAVDTATTAVGVALATDDGPLAKVQVIEGRRHGELLAPALRQVCDLAGVALADVNRLAVDVGPGLFTGLRVGLSTVTSLAHALDRPAVGITSLEVLAAAHAGNPRPVAVVVDIRRGEVAWARAEAGRLVTPPAVARPDDLREELRGALAVGDGALRHAATLGCDVGPPSAAHPDPAVLAELALGREPGELHPVYLRDADVRIGWQQAPGTRVDG